MSMLPLTLEPQEVGGTLRDGGERAPLANARLYIAESSGDRLVYDVPQGALAQASYLTCDMLLDGVHLTTFTLSLHEPDQDTGFRVHFGLLNQCQARVRIPLNLTDMNRWGIDREGAFLKPRVAGERVDLSRVCRIELQVSRKAEGTVRFSLTPITVTAEEPPRVAEPLLPKGALLDEMGQSTLVDWPTKRRNKNELKHRIEDQLYQAPLHHWPDAFSEWGGWTSRKLEATGFFRNHHDGKRWWLVDPQGHPFWSAGMDCVMMRTEGVYEGLEPALTWLPEDNPAYRDIFQPFGSTGRMINYLKANFIRTFGPDSYQQSWAQIALGELRRYGFNTVGNWSDWPVARDAQFPYVRPLSPSFPNTPMVFRDFPDVFAPSFENDAAAYAEQLRETADDPAFMGYFLMNEPNWGFTHETPAAGMLHCTPECATRRALAEFLHERHGDSAGLSEAWGIETTLEAVATGDWNEALGEAAQTDLQDFSAVMVERLFGTLSRACREVDPNHLNLGARYYTVPPRWVWDGMRSFDVFSMNCYREKVLGDAEEVSDALDCPVMIGEWHFGALDAGLPASGIGHVRNHVDRGRAFRVYTEDAASRPWCVGAHWFTLYDQSAIGRFDGENFNIGFLDICNQRYEPLCVAARVTHERMYDVASGAVAPYDDAPEYLPLLFS